MMNDISGASVLPTLYQKQQPMLYEPEGSKFKTDKDFTPPPHTHLKTLLNCVTLSTKCHQRQQLSKTQRNGSLHGYKYPEYEF